MGQLAEEPLDQEFSTYAVHQNHLGGTGLKRERERIFLGFTPRGSDLEIFILGLRRRYSVGHTTKYTP